MEFPPPVRVKGREHTARVFNGLHQNLYRAQVSCGLLEPPGDGSPLNFVVQVFVIPIPSTPAQHRSDVVVDRLDLPEEDLLVAVGKGLGGLPELCGLPANRTVKGFAVSPADPKAMYVTMRDGLFKRTDAEESWRPLGKGLKNLAAVVVNPKRPGEVYASTRCTWKAA